LTAIDAPATLVQVIGQLCGKYRLIESIGGGSGSDVFRAEHELTGETAAVRVFGRTGDRVADDGFEQLRTIARVEHPGLARILDFGRLDDGGAFVATELIDGEPLGDGPEPLAVCLNRGRQIAEALAALHAAGASHGGLRRSTVLVCDGGLKLVDCGVAMLANDGIEGSPASDVAALGELLFRTITGQAVGGASISELVPEAPVALAGLLDSMLVVDPIERPEMPAVADAIAAVHAATTAPTLYEEAEPTVLDARELAPRPLGESPTIDDLPAPGSGRDSNDTIEPLDEPLTEEDLSDAAAGALDDPKTPASGDPAGVDGPESDGGALVAMIEEEAVGDDAPTMIVPAAIDPAALQEPPPPRPPPVIERPTLEPPAVAVDTHISGAFSWPRWATIAAVATAILLIFALARSCGDDTPATTRDGGADAG
jgi:serine/threonine-protein kinase